MEEGEKKSCFKLKISPNQKKITTVDDDNEQDHDHDHDHHDEKDENLLLPFECPDCKQRFKSGKALGGHKRIHGEKYQNNTKNANVVKPRAIDKRKTCQIDEEDEDDENPVCPICRKSFPSKKSVFGHMRSHPERTWRGIQPPPPPPPPPPPADDNDDDDHHHDHHTDDQESSSSYQSPKTPTSNADLNLSLKKKGNWSVTSKRGSGKRKTSSSPPSPSRLFGVPVMENDTKNAVINLMVFAHQKPNARADLLTILQRIRESKKAKSEEEKKAEKEDDEENSMEDVEEYFVLQRIKDKNRMMKRRKKIKLVDGIEEADQEEGEEEEEEEDNTKKLAKSGEYVCSICSKSFQSYQALGGHTSSHNKNKTKNNIKIKTKNHLSTTRDNVEDSDDDSMSSTIDKAAAAGGNEDRSSDRGGGRKNVFEFDLNELPPSDD